MASYYLQTSEGAKGPFPAAEIRQGIDEGRISPNAPVNDALTGRSLLACEVRLEPAPQISGPVDAAHPVRFPQPRRATGIYAYQAAPAPSYPGAYPPGQPYGAPQQYMPYAPPRQTSGLAIAALVLTLTTLPTCLPTFIGGIICGAMALKETGPGGKDGRGMAQAGLWLGVAFAVLYLAFIGLFIVAIAMDK